MIELPEPGGPLNAYRLVEDDRAVRAGGETAPAGGSVGLSTPMVLPITEKLIGGDAELAAFWSAEQGKFRYDYVAFRCAFEPGPRPFEKAYVEVRLEPAGGPVAWSMAPQEVSDKQKLVEKVSLKSDFKVVGSGIENSLETETKSWLLRARTANAVPYWEFRPTASSAIDGEYKLVLVTRTPAAQAASGRITVKAQAAGRTFLIFPVGAGSEISSSVDFPISAPAG